MAYSNIYIGENAQSFKSSPKFKAIDMVVLNISDELYVSSPYAKLIDESKWSSVSNGAHVFEFDVENGMWMYYGEGYTSEELNSEYGIEVYYASIPGKFTDNPKDGDAITVNVIKDSAPESEETDASTIECEMTRSGQRLAGDCPLCKASFRQTVADTILANVAGYKYQPFNASAAKVNPLAELGDGITAHGVYAGLYQQDLDFNSLLTSDISAPAKEEVDHEYEYESASERKFARRFASVASEFNIMAGEISAKVSQVGGNADHSFGWSLLIDSWKVTANGRDVFIIDKDGATVVGKITAEEGYIGTKSKGFKITENAMMNGMTSLGDTESRQGVYIGTDGIALGAGKFVVTKGGVVTASDLTLTGGAIKLGPKIYIDGDGNQQTAGYNFEVANNGVLNLGAVLDEDNNISYNFSVDRYGRITAKGMTLTDGALNIGSITSEAGNSRYNFELTKTGELRLGAVRDETDEVTGYNFKVDRFGKVTASDLNITGGTISIGSRFRVDSSGNLRAEFTSGTIRMGPKGSETDEDGNVIPAGYNFDLSSSGSLSVGCVINDDGEVSHNFTVGTSGRVTAKDIRIIGGSISIVNPENDSQSFSVSSSGRVSATDLHADSAYLTGTLHVGGTDIEAAILRFGAQKANDTHEYWSNGSKYGYDFDKASQQDTTEYRNNFRANTVSAVSGFSTNGTVICRQLVMAQGDPSSQWSSWNSVDVIESVSGGGAYVNEGFWYGDFFVVSSIASNDVRTSSKYIEYIGLSPK